MRIMVTGGDEVPALARAISDAWSEPHAMVELSAPPAGTIAELEAQLRATLQAIDDEVAISGVFVRGPLDLLAQLRALDPAYAIAPLRIALDDALVSFAVIALVPATEEHRELVYELAGLGSRVIEVSDPADASIVLEELDRF